MNQNSLNFIRRFWLAANNMYFVLFFVWFFASMLTHGRFPFINLMNMFAFEVFLLFIPVFITGIIYRIKLFMYGGLVALVLFGLTFGELYIPKQNMITDSDRLLKVMTYNMLAYTPNSTAILDVIRQENAGIVFMQETNFEVEGRLQKEMLDVYPYQIHYPSDLASGTSVISKYPFKALKHDMDDETFWIGKPIVLRVDWDGAFVTVINFHMVTTVPFAIAIPSLFNQISNYRKDEAEQIIKVLKDHPGPAIVAGDVNDVFLNDPYRLLIGAGLQDAWREAGFGLGHTFPGNKSPGTSRIHVGNLYVPEWMVRIDYIFVSQDWDVITANLAPTDGYSDHRGVVASLRLK